MAPEESIYRNTSRGQKMITDQGTGDPPIPIPLLGALTHPYGIQITRQVWFSTFPGDLDELRQVVRIIADQAHPPSLVAMASPTGWYFRNNRLKKWLE